jgi:hypothetical protein
MSFWISIAGGLLIMMGHHARSEALFCYFRLEDQVPESHLLRLIEKHINFGFVRERSSAAATRQGSPDWMRVRFRSFILGFAAHSG